MRDVTGPPAGLTGNKLKLIALVSMTLDHIGALLVANPLLRIIGRLAFPIFAYMIAEGCAHSRDRKRYLLQMAALAAAIQAVYFLVMSSLTQSVLVTFSLSICLIFLLDRARRDPTPAGIMAALGALCGIFFLCEILPGLLRKTDFRVDYGFCGVMLPVLVYFGRNRWEKLTLFALGTVALGLYHGGLQWFALAAVVLVAFYNGRRGKCRMKYLFYVYYPAHLAVIWLIGLVM